MDFTDQKELLPVLQKYQEDISIVFNQLQSFNYFLDHDIQNILMRSQPIILEVESLNLRYTIKFGPGVRISFPSITENKQVKEISIFESLSRDLTYSSPIDIDVTVIIESRSDENF